MFQMLIQTFIRLFLPHLVGNYWNYSFIRHLNKHGFAFIYLSILKLWPLTFRIGIRKMARMGQARQCVVEKQT